ncbi:hypothetical protein FV242_32340 [Methylobacterium sp. WL64]|uniref:hypothetical protein n=1 Tax=Methylobacterium sp. WL64 TaxID=2603894 RepID=UPI0011CB26BA|nr:hypothetical protein [Methylobacterium sp. WL64]TXM97126.1 hypothetical protein FV242_32340 [Methylobacterium sp. WL64]
MLDNIARETDAGNDLPSGTSVFPTQENIAEVGASSGGSQDSFQQIKNACAECKAYGGGEGFFGRKFDDRVLRLLLPGYKGLLLVADDPDRLAVVVRHSEVKTTKATLKNPALIFVKMGAKPHGTAQDKLCSNWADILNKARAERISVEEFVPWVMKRDALRQRLGVANKRPKPTTTQDLNQLQLRLTGADGPIDEILQLPPAVHATLLDALKKPGLQSERVQRLGRSLLTLADELKLVEGESSSSPDQVKAHEATAEVVDV